MQAEVMTAEGPSATALHDSAGLVVAPPGLKTSVGCDMKMAMLADGTMLNVMMVQMGVIMKMMMIVIAMMAINYEAHLVRKEQRLRCWASLAPTTEEEVLMMIAMMMTTIVVLPQQQQLWSWQRRRNHQPPPSKTMNPAETATRSNTTKHIRQTPNITIAVTTSQPPCHLLKRLSRHCENYRGGRSLIR